MALGEIGEKWALDVGRKALGVSPSAARSVDRAGTQAARSARQSAIPPDRLELSGDPLGDLLSAIPGLGSEVEIVKTALRLLEKAGPELKKDAKIAFETLHKAEKVPSRIPVRDQLVMIRDLADKNLRLFRTYTKAYRDQRPAMRQNLETISKIADLSPHNQYTQLVGSLARETLAKGQAEREKGLLRNEHNVYQMGSDHIRMVSRQGVEGLKRYLVEGHQD